MNRALIWLYRPVIKAVLRHRILTIAIAVLTLALSIYPATRIGSMEVRPMKDGGCA